MKKPVDSTQKTIKKQKPAPRRYKNKLRNMGFKECDNDFCKDLRVPGSYETRKSKSG
jgi:hypothetical protein